jgi:hypothetical protein
VCTAAGPTVTFPSNAAKKAHEGLESSYSARDFADLTTAYCRERISNMKSQQNGRGMSYLEEFSRCIKFSDTPGIQKKHPIRIHDGVQPMSYS